MVYVHNVRWITNSPVPKIKLSQLLVQTVKMGHSPIQYVYEKLKNPVDVLHVLL